MKHGLKDTCWGELMQAIHGSPFMIQQTHVISSVLLILV